MISLVTITWFAPDGTRPPQPADSPVPAAQWAAIARSRHGWVQLEVRDRDASLNYDPGRVSPDAMRAAERALDRLGPVPASVTLVEWHGEQVTRRVLSRLDADDSDLYAGLASF
ncbi:MAG: hypothetical protein RLO51_14040 [Thalassobaculum sp.]|uniref:hypothetical protein n=1 Tax=Thalassobaculum sp. TaxID=2022740 RepID=UPI0032F02C7B